MKAVERSLDFFMPLAWLYALIGALRRGLYERGILHSEQLPGTVISVGNLEAGGTGKSPIVMELANRLKAAGHRPAILTRGYRSGLKATDSAAILGQSLILSPQSQGTFHADEATMQAAQLEDVPVIIGRQRFFAAKRYLAHFSAPSHWILDDGFQHLQLSRQVDIVLLDAARPLANGRCIPAGRLRENPSALQKADLIILTRALNNSIPEVLHDISGLNTIPKVAAQFINDLPRWQAGSKRDWSSCQSIGLVLGIAKPERIVQHCKAQAYAIKQQVLVSDHEQIPVNKLLDLSKLNDAILTSEKDYWRQPETFNRLACPVFVLPLTVAFFESETLTKFFNGFTKS